MFNAQSNKNKTPTVGTRVVDPAFYLNADPDLDPDPGSQTNADPDPGQTLTSQKVDLYMKNIPIGNRSKNLPKRYQNIFERQKNR